jgi:simple sugar transport system permease protein
MKTRLQALMRELVPSLAAIGCAALLGMLIVLLIGRNPLAVAGEVVRAMRPNGLRDDAGYVLAYATPLIFTGLSVAVAFRAGLFNIGGMGQVMVGSMLAGLVGWKCSALPAAVLLPLAAAVAAAGGAAWAAIAGTLKAWRGSHEVIITIMLNFLAIALCDWVVNGPLKDPHGMIAQLPAIGEHARLPRLGALGLPFPNFVPVNAGLFVALALAAAAWIGLFRTTAGYELRAVGHNPEAARAAGISVPRVTVLAMALSGALAGIAATDIVMGYKHVYRQDDAMGYGNQAFVGIAVALMGRNHPIALVPAALLFGALQRTGHLFSTIPKDLILVLQAAVILFVICGQEIFRRALARKAAPA